MSSLVVQTSFLGDIVLTTPLLRELASRGPVDVLTSPEGAAILSNNPSIRNVIVYDRRECDSGLAGFGRAVGRIRRTGLYGSAEASVPRREANAFYAEAYLAQGSLRSAMLVTAAGVKRRIGFNTSEGRRFYTHRVEYRSDRHHAERLWRLASPDRDPGPEQISPSLFPTADDDQAAAAVVREQISNPARPFIALAPGSVWATKRWPFYPELAQLITQDFNVVVVGGGADVAIGDAIVSQLPNGCAANAAGRLGILASAALIGRAVALVTNDSAPQHLASAMNIPTVTTFGPTVPGFGFGPLAQHSHVAGVDALACRPCDRHGPQKCPLGHWRCMRELSSADVFGLLTQTLSQVSSV
ncbi:MAG TPA: glycosyltransferase family 9 protein [Gemmatimonadaceae bacterium]|nr:glycosyltransferase family 9 protein [Gemmatimonadaceae bacterium]